jgi:hypothetical protein
MHNCLGGRTDTADFAQGIFLGLTHIGESKKVVLLQEIPGRERCAYYMLEYTGRSSHGKTQKN